MGKAMEFAKTAGESFRAALMTPAKREVLRASARLFL
jgi:hypothetical protein